MKAQDLLDMIGYVGNEILVHSITGAKDTAKNWAEICADETLCDNGEEDFFSLEEV
jgi:hypothetical protein